MTVQEAYDNLGKIIADGNGFLDLIYRDTRSGDTGSVSVYTTIEKIKATEYMGRLCDEPLGYQYVPVYCDH